MNYFRNKTTSVVISEQELRESFPNTSLPAILDEATLASLDYDVLFEGAKVEATRYKYSMRSGEEKIGDKWFTKYILAPVFSQVEEETAYNAILDNSQANSIRELRDQMLTACDWTQTSDAKVDKMAWASYRQSLRDISSASGFPWDTAWPVTPSSAPTAVPQYVTRRQARQALYNAGKLDNVLPALNAIVNVDDRNLAIIEWEDSQVFERSRPLVILMGTALGMDSTQLDNLFIAAAQL
jgi:hypothetical protein